MQKELPLRRRNIAGLLVFGVSLIMSSIIWVKKSQDIQINSSHATFIKMVSLSNEISSYAKRAEGHLFLFLTLDIETDREKFFARIKRLHALIEQLSTFDQQFLGNKLISNLRSTASALEDQGTLLFEKKNHAGAEGSFDFHKYHNEVLVFHRSSSSIRKQGVEAVQLFSKALESNNILVRNSNNFKFQIILLLAITSLSFLIYINHQYKKLFLADYQIEHMAKLSYSDSLTKIFNRRKFDEEFETLWKNCRRNSDSFSLLMIDVDFFKKYNDRYGHTEGDRCLYSVAQVLLQTANRTTDIVCRYGGEEFAIILTGTSDAFALAEYCRREVEALHIPNKSSDVSKFVTISVGVGEVTAASTSTVQESIKAIDEALYIAKSQGRNQVVQI
ncbi:MAG: diguanylate cyclase domain-containing protein [Methylophagaceae bacterium]